MKNVIFFFLSFSFCVSINGFGQTCGSTNIALGRPSFQSSANGSYTAAFMVDGILATTTYTNPWIPSGTGIQWAYFTLANPSDICRVVVSWTRWNYADFILQGTNTDPATTTPTWTNLVTVTGNNPTVGTIPSTTIAYQYNDLSIASTGTSYKYIRLYLPNSTTTQVLEMELYARTAANVPPVISITAPANNTSFTAGGNITITANATDADGTVSKVDFYNGTTLLGTSTTPVSGSTYQYVWNAVPAGSYTINAKATDNSSAVTSATSVAITVSASTGGTGWNLNGNTVGAVKTIGTIDNYDLPIITNNSEKLRVLATGKVGIGTTTPADNLEINGSGTALRISGAIGDNLALNFGGSGTVYHKIVSNANAGFFDIIAGASGSGHNIRFFTDNVEKMRVTSAGNVGIGTASPQATLDINGTIKTLGLYFPVGFGAGKVLTSDANGNASWQTATGGTGGSSSWATSGSNISNSNAGLVIIGAVPSVLPTDANLKLAVNGNIYAQKLKITALGWADYVFAPNYKLRSITNLSNFIKLNQHLPDLPSAIEAAKAGVDVGETQTVLLKKIEELTLYLIKEHEEIQQLKKSNKRLENRVKKLNKN